jgi:tetratricopeptide (TPR) repeat protein/predicted Ser/Thr protein kinase
VDTEPTETAAPAGRSLPELGRGTCIGRYVILDRLGKGGMGVVYRAYDPDLDRRVALKLVRDLSDEATARLIGEAQALAKVSHPHIVQVFDVGTFADTVFIAMELVEGRTLSRWHAEEQPDWRGALAHLLEAARGLAAAHAAGLIHRDFKPNNAIVGGDGRVRVLDFGLARVTGVSTGERFEDSSPFSTRRGADESTAGETALEIPERLDLDGDTEEEPDGLPRVLASRVIGTPVYMAPEQRKRGVIDARADQFAFAVAAWELLHGERPFDGADAKSYAEATAAHRLRPPPAGSRVPPWVRRVLTRALSPAPPDRFRSMDDLIAALEADPGARWRRLGLAALALALVGGGAALLASRDGAPAPCEGAASHLAGVWDGDVGKQLEVAFAATGAPYAARSAATVRAALDDRAHAWVVMHHEACEATRVRGEQSPELLDLRMSCLDRRRGELRALVAALTSAPDAARVQGAADAVGRLPDVEVCADRDALTAVIPPPSDPAAQAAIAEEREELATIEALLWTGQWREARERALRAEARAAQLGWAPLEAEAAYRRGLAERLAGDFDAAELALRASAQAAARAHLDDLAADVWSELVVLVGYERARPAEGLALAAAAEAILARADAPPSVVAGLAHARALTLFSYGDHASALLEAERAVGLLEAAKGEDDPEVAEVVNTVAMIVSAMGEHPRAEAAHRRVLAIREHAYGAGHPKLADSLDNIGVTLFHQGKHAEARALYEEALALRVASLGPDHRDVGTSHNNLGSLFLDRGDEAAATRHLEQALAVYERALGEDHADLAIPLSNLGELASKRGDHVRAVEYCERALALDLTAAGPDDPDLAYDLVCLGEAYLGLGDAARALPVLERAMALREGLEAGREVERTQKALERAKRASRHVKNP